MTMDKPSSNGLHRQDKKKPGDCEYPWLVSFKNVGTSQFDKLAIDLELCNAMVIGRSDGHTAILPEIDLADYDASYYGVSRQHALLMPTTDCVYFTDLDSTNGSWVNGEKVESGMKVALHTGDRVEIGQMKFIITINGGPPRQSVDPPKVTGKLTGPEEDD